MISEKRWEKNSGSNSSYQWCMCRVPFYFGCSCSVGVRKFFTRKGIKALAVLLLSPFAAEKITFEAHEKKLARIHWDNWININLEREAFIKEFKTILRGGMNKWWRKFTQLFKVNFIPMQSSAGKVSNNCNFRCQIVVHSVAELKFEFPGCLTISFELLSVSGWAFWTNFGELFLHWCFFDLFPTN